MLHKTGQEIDKLLTDLASLCQTTRDADAVAELLKKQHRTHQQSLGRFIQASIKVFSQAHEDHHYDLRNEATCKMCSEIIDQVEEFTLPFI